MSSLHFILRSIRRPLNNLIQACLQAFFYLLKFCASTTFTFHGLAVSSLKSSEIFEDNRYQRHLTMNCTRSLTISIKQLHSEKNMSLNLNGYFKLLFNYNHLHKAKRQQSDIQGKINVEFFDPLPNKKNPITGYVVINFCLFFLGGKSSFMEPITAGYPLLNLIQFLYLLAGI